MIIDRLVTELGWEVDTKALDAFHKENESIVKGFKWIAGAAALAGSAIAALGGIVLQETVRNIKLAESVGMSADAYLAWEGVMKQVGFEGEKVVDLMEEMTNKLGEFKGLGEMTSAREGLSLLGVQFQEIKDLAPEEQFVQILDAAKSLEDVQVAQSAVDMLMGGEANRVLGVLRQYDGSIQDILDRHRALNLMTDEGIEGATRWSYAWNNLTTSAKSLFTELAGQVGGVLEPYINKILDWVAANRELIKSGIDDFLKELTQTLRWLVWAGTGIKDIVESLGGLTNVMRLSIAAIVSWKAAGWILALQKILPALMAAAKGTGLLTVAAKLFGRVPIVALFTAAAFALQDLYVYLKGGKSYFGDLANEYVPKLESKLLSLTGVTNKLTEAEKDALRVRDRLADDVDVQAYYDQQQTYKFRQDFLATIEAVKAGFTSFGSKAAEVFDFIVGDVKAFGSVVYEVFSSIAIGIKDWGIASLEILDAIKNSDAAAFLMARFGEFYDVAARVFSMIYEAASSLFGYIAETDVFAFLKNDVIAFGKTAMSVIDRVIQAVKSVPILGSLFGGGDGAEAVKPSAPPAAQASMVEQTPRLSQKRLREINKYLTTQEHRVQELARTGRRGEARAEYEKLNAMVKMAKQETRVAVNAPINVTAAPGMDTAAVGREVSRQLSSAVQTAVRETNTGVKR